MTPAGQMPWVVSSPFRMRPGLARLPVHAGVQDGTPAPPPRLFVRDALAGAYAAHKRDALDVHRGRAQVGQADRSVLAAMAEAYAAESGVRIAAEADALALGLQEDFVILHDEGDGFRTRFLSVCFPSNWSPADKLGLDFAAIHAPVADNALLQSGARGIVDMAFRQAPMLRHVWLLTPGGALAQHPETRRVRWADALAAAEAPGATGRLIDRVFFRVERQTTLPLPALRRGVFFIRVMVCPLAEVLRAEAGRAAQLAEAMDSMSEAVVAYRGMSSARDRLVGELRAWVS